MKNLVSIFVLSFGFLGMSHTFYKEIIPREINFTSTDLPIESSDYSRSKNKIKLIENAVVFRNHTTIPEHKSIDENTSKPTTLDDPSFDTSISKNQFDEGEVVDITVTLTQSQDIDSNFRISNISDTVNNDDYSIQTGSTLTFSKTWEEDPNNEAYQDRINDYVWITRGISQGLYNTAPGEFNETNGSGGSSPNGVEFALGSYSEGIENLTFVPAASRNYNIHPKDNLRKDYVMKVVAGITTNENGETEYEYDYYSLKFIVWDQGSNRDGWRETDTSVTYERSKHPLNAKNGFTYFSVPAGESEIVVSINTKNDGTAEGIENYSFLIEGVSNVELIQKTVSFEVDDKADISLSIDTTELDEGQSTVLSATLESPRAFDTNIDFTISGDNINAQDHRFVLDDNIAAELLAGEGEGNKLNFLNNPYNYDLDAAGNIYINDRNNCRILKITPGNLTATLVKQNACGVDLQVKNDYLYVLESHVVWRKYIGDDSSIDDREFTVAGGNGSGTDLHQLRATNRDSKLYVDDNENVYVLDGDNHRVVKWEPNATDGILIAGSDIQGQSGNKLNELYNPRDFQVTKDGKVYVADSHNYRILKFTEGVKDGELILGNGVQGNGTVNQLTYVYQIYVDAAETLYVADESNQRIVMQELGKSPVVIAGGNGYGNELNQLTNPTGFVLDVTGGVYVYDRENRRIMYWPKGADEGIDVSTDKIGITANSWVKPLKLDNDGNVLYLDQENSKLWRINNTPRIMISAGEVSSKMSIQILEDGLYENTETMTLSANSIRDTELEQTVITITNTDTLPSVSLELNQTNIDENQLDDVTLTISLDKKSVLPTTLNLSLSGTAEIETEYTISNTSITIPAGEIDTTVTISTTNLDDDTIELLETIIITPIDVVNATIATENTTLNLLSDEYPTLSLSPDTTDYNEGDIQEFSVELSEAHSKSTIVQIDFEGSMSANDYIITNPEDDEFNLVTFSKTWEDNPGEASYQDRINDYVWLTRGIRQGLYNTAPGEFNEGGSVGQGNGSPKGVEFALGSYSEGVENLSFFPEISNVNNNHPKNNLGRDYVMKVVSDVSTNDSGEQVYKYDYYSLKFSFWDQGSNRNGWKITDTAVTYKRSRYPLSNNSTKMRVKAGETTAKYTVEFRGDLNYEGEETLVKNFTLTNTVSSDFSKTLTVDDFVDINTSISKTEVTEGESTSITATITEARPLETIVNFGLSGTAVGDDISTTMELPNNGIQTLFGVNEGNDNGISNMMLHKGNVYFSIHRNGVFKINADKTYSRLINYEDEWRLTRSFTLDSQDNIYVVEDNTVYKFTASSNYNYQDRVEVTVGANNGSELNQLRNPESIIIDENGDMIIVDTGNHRVVKWEQGGTEGTLLFGDPNGGYASGNSGLNSPENIVFDGTYYYVLDSNNRRRIVVLDSDFNYVSSTINFNNSTAPEQYYIKSMFVKNDKIYVPLGLSDWTTIYDDKQGEIAVFNTYSESSPMVLQDLIEFKYTNELNEQVIPANSRGYFVIDDNGNYFLQGDGNKIYYKQNAPQIVIPAGKLSSTVDITAVDDLSYEGPEELIFNPNSPNNDIAGNLTLNITDNDKAPAINITFSEPFIDENQEEVVTVYFTPEVKSGLEISFDIELSGTATLNDEYVVSNNKITIPANAVGSVTVSTKGLDDVDIEVAETIIFSLTNLVNASFENQGTLELHSDDYPVASLSIDDTKFAEHETLNLKATVSAPHSKVTTISYVVVENGAIAEQYKDYYFTSSAGTVKITNPSTADDQNPEYQDRIFDKVWLTRGKNGGLYNAYDQVAFNRDLGNYEAQRQNPTGTLWAVGSIENLSELTFAPINEWGQKFRPDRSNEEGHLLNKEMVLYLTETKEYYSFIMTDWGQGGENAGFSYTRSKGAIKEQLDFTIPAGETQGFASISGIEDDIMTEGTESFSVSFNSIENATIEQTDNIDLTILDNVTSMTLREDIFIGVQNGDFSWGDFDSDGDKDLALIGDAGETLISKVYENTVDENGKVVFQEIDVQFTGVGFGAVEWVDLNQDGKIDLFISGVDENVDVRSLVYINNSTAGNPSFELVDTYNFPVLVETSLDFGDLDNDGDVDYAITGYDSNQQLQAYYGYQNIETSNFDIKRANFDAFVNGELRIVDIDSDGDNDVIYTGGNDITGEKGGVIYNTYVPNANSDANYWDSWWQNDQLRAKYSTLEIFKPQDTNAVGYMVMGAGKAYAVNSQLTVPQLKNGDIAAGDFNNNGVDDFLFTGESETGEGYTKLFEGKSRRVLNSETGNYDLYVESVFQFDQLINSSAEWVDYDNDGDLDLFMIGLKIGEGEKTYLYETEVNNKKNAKPEIITGLDSELVGNGVVSLSWDKPTDDYTEVLGYNVRLGKTSGGTELSYTISNLDTGDLLVSKSPNNYNLFYKTQLEPGTYYWSVQAVDQGLKAGPYSEENSFTLTYDWKILNQGGLFDKRISSGRNPMLKVVDIDEDEDLDVIITKDTNQVEFYSYNDGILEKTTLNGFDQYHNNIKEIQFADFMNQSANGLFMSLNNELKGYLLGDTPNYQEYNGSDYNEKTNNWEEAVITEFSNGTRVVTFQDGTQQVTCYTENCVVPEKMISIGVEEIITIGNLNLYEEKYGIADFNNDGINEIFVIGVDSDIDVFMDVKFYMFSYNKSNNSFDQIDLTNQITDIGRIKGPSFDFGDYDNDQDLDIIISGDKIVGTSITKIFKNITNPGDTEIKLEATSEAITGVSNGSTNFIDFDSDGDLDILLSGTNDTGNDVFELFENDLDNAENTEGKWETITTNLVPMKNTNVDLGDFNGDGYTDMLISGETATGKETKLMEYTPAAGFIKSDFDVSDIVDARVEFGDLDGDEDLDFVIAGKSKTNEEQNIFRTYLNYRNESYEVTNPPTFNDIDFMAKHEDNKTQVIMKEGIEVASILLEYENEVSLDMAATMTELIALSSNGNPLSILTNKNKIVLYGDVSKVFSRQTFTTILIHNNQNSNQLSGNTLQRILSVAALKDGKLKSITADSKIYDSEKDNLSGFSQSSIVGDIKLQTSKISSYSNNKLKSTSFRAFSEDQNTEINNTNVKPDMPYLLNTTVVDGELDKSLGKLFVELSWRSAVDDNTDLEGLSYAIKMGTSSGAENVVSSNSSVNGVRKAAGKGNAEHNTKWKIALEPGTYYWSVQSIDNAQTGSEFSFENVFTVSEDNLLYDLGDSNGDDKVNIADIINLIDFMLDTNPTRFIEYASDVNDDDKINVLDLMSIVDIILNPTNIVESSISVNNSDNTNSNNNGIRSVEDIDYRSSEAVGDVVFYWDNETLYMQSEHKVGGMQLTFNNDADVMFSNKMSPLNKTKIQKGESYDMVFYSMSAVSLEDDIAVLSYYGDKDAFDFNSILVSTTNGYKLNVKVETLSKDEIINENSFVFRGVYPNPVVNNLITMEYFTPTALSNQEISIFDILGREVFKQQLANSSVGLQMITLDLDNLPNGVMFLEYSAITLDDREIKQISKFIKQ